MRILGLPVPFTRQKALETVSDGRGWFRIMEPWAGAWQRNVSVDANTAQSNHAVFACQTLIASDVAKLRVKLVQKQTPDIWPETTNSAYSPVLRKPNHFQNRIQFFESWVLSKLQTGNSVILKERDGRGVVVGLYVLDWCRVRPMIADNGDVFYQLSCDKLADLAQDVVVPAREIIHDRFNCLFHPLVGVTPIFAAGLAATHGLAIQDQATKFFQNGARPGGILTAAGKISDETANRLKESWEQKYSGENAGKIAVLGDGLKYDSMTAKSNDAQLIEQLKWTAEQICGVFHVPPYKIGIGQMPTFNNIQALNVEYFGQAIQRMLEDIELCLDEGLGIGDGVSINGQTYGTEFDVDNLLRMDSITQMQVLKESAGILSPNEQRAKLGQGPKPGGESPMLQQQNYSLEALAKRDAQADPFGTAPPPIAPAKELSADDVAEKVIALLPAPEPLPEPTSPATADEIAEKFLALLPKPEPIESPSDVEGADKQIAAAVEKIWEAQLAA